MWPRDTAQVRIVEVSVVHEPGVMGAHELLVVCHDLSEFQERMVLEKDRELLLTQIKLERTRWDLALSSSAGTRALQPASDPEGTSAS